MDVAVQKIMLSKERFVVSRHVCLIRDDLTRSSYYRIFFLCFVLFSTKI